MRFSILSLLLFLFNFCSACDCDDLGKLAVQDIDKSDYIALVRIKDILPVTIDSPHYSGYGHYFKIVIEVLTHYKGNQFSEIIVAGGNAKFNTWTSCDFGMNTGQEWLIFGQYEKSIPFVYPCTRTEIYRKENGFRDLQYQSSFKSISFLDSLFGKKEVKSNIKAGVIKTFYPNGKVEKVEHYKNGALNGLVEYYYPEGSLYGKSVYQNGQLHGKSLWYYRNGNIERESHYANGIKVDTSIYYSITAEGYKPRFITIYDINGDVIHSQEYGGTFKDYYLVGEAFYEPLTKKVKQVYYFKNGQVSEVSYRLKWKPFGEYIQYNEAGNIIRQWKYDEEGKVIK